MAEVFHQSRSQPQHFLYLWVVCSCLYVQLFIGSLFYCPISCIFLKFSRQEVCKTVFSAVFCLEAYFNSVVSQGMGAVYGQPIASDSPCFTQHSSPLLCVSPSVSAFALVRGSCTAAPCPTQPLGKERQPTVAFDCIFHTLLPPKRVHLGSIG